MTDNTKSWILALLMILLVGIGVLGGYFIPYRVIVTAYGDSLEDQDGIEVELKRGSKWGLGFRGAFVIIEDANFAEGKEVD